MSTFRWITNDGRELAPIEMATEHVFNSLKMLWNNLADYTDRIVDERHPFKRWWDLQFWDAVYIRKAAYELTTELLLRGPTECGEIQGLLINLVGAAQRNHQSTLFDMQSIKLRAATVGILVAVGTWVPLEVANNEISMHRVRGTGTVRKSNVRRRLPKSRNQRAKSRSGSKARSNSRRKTTRRPKVRVRRRVRP
jgi:hypothetical protein